MATITTAEYWDSGTARVSGEACNVNGGTVTFRTDTRYHAGFTSGSMLGSVSGLNISNNLGGKIIIDATKVRWMEYSSGTGNVPAIGTSVTQGGVAGYLLGVFANAASAPTTAGSAMPTSGFIKFREVTGGAFSAGALTGIGASASSADVVGWIEIVTRNSFTTGAAGGVIETRGDWFELGTTNGSRGQTFQVPTNGGGAGTHVWGFQIETGPSTGVYEWWTTAQTAGSWNTTNLSTDARSKYIAQSVGDGVIRIGSDGTNNIGWLPPSGCKVRIMNIFGRTSATTTTTANPAPGSVTRTNVSVSSGGGLVDLQFLHADWDCSALSFAELKFKNVSFEFAMAITSSLKPSTIEGLVVGGYTQPAAPLSITTAIVGYTIKDVLVSTGTTPTNGIFRITSCKNISLENVNSIYTKVRTSAAGYAIQIDNSTDVTSVNMKLRGYGINLLTCSNSTFTNVDYMDSIKADTTSVQGLQAFRITVCSNVVIDGITLGDNGAIANSHPYNQMFLTIGNTGTVKIRNAGTRTNRISLGGATIGTGVIWQSNSYETDIRLQRLYFNNTRTGVIQATSTTARNILVEHFYGLTTQTNQHYAANSIYRGNGYTTAMSTTTGVVGLMWTDNFTSDTTGEIVFHANLPTADQAGLWSLTTTNTKGVGYDGAGQLRMHTNGDEFIVEMPNFVIGHTGFSAAIAPTPTGFSSGSFANYFYQIDKGAGWNGTWISATSANMSAETGISASTGFKLKLRVVGNATITTSGALQLFKFNTVSTLAAQVANLYPLDTVALGFTGLIAGSEVRVYAGTNPATAVEIGGTDSSGTTFSFSHSSAGVAGVIAIFAMGYQPIYLPYTFKSTDDSILIQQVIDRNYVNP